MTGGKQDGAPKWPGKVIEWYCGERTAEDLIGDIQELYFKNISTTTRRKAKLKYCLQAMSLLFSYAASVRRKRRTINNRSTQNTYSMYKNYFKVAFRSLSKQKFFSIINILGLSVGMSVGLLAVASFVDTLTVDDFHTKKDRIYRVVSESEQFMNQPAGTKWASVPEAVGYEFGQGHQGIEQVVRFNKSLNGMVSNPVEDLPIYGYYTDANFFEVFGYTLSSGNPNTALKEPYSIVITKKTSEKYFHGKDPIGEEMLLIGQGTFRVTGVLNESARSHLLFEALASYSTIPLVLNDDHIGDWYDLSASYTYLLVDDLNAVDAISQSLRQIPTRVYPKDKIDYATFELQAMSSIPMNDDLNNEIGITWGWLVLVLFFALALLILAPACFNYANLSISRALQRSKEIGLRKVVGGQRKQIFTQFLLESCLITLVSLIGAIGLFIVAKDTFMEMIVHGREMFDFELDIWTITGFVIFALMAGGIAGLAPALYFSRLSPLETLRASNTPSRLKKFSLRKALIVGQFALSLFFIMGIAIIMKQYKYALNYNFGFEKENILDVRLNGVDPIQLKTELQKLPEISKISFSSHIAGTHETREAFVAIPEINDSTLVYQMFVDPDYLSNMNIELIAGQNLPEIPTQEESFIVVNERFLKKFQINNPLDALSQAFIVDGKNLTVIGVVKDFNFRALREDIDAFFFRYDPDRFGYVNLRIASNDITKTISKIDASWKIVAEGRKFEAAFMEDELEEALISFQSVIKIFGGLGLLSIIISCLGLLGMVVFTVENKMKELGIKKVMGATSFQLMTGLSADFLKLLIYAAIITIPVAYFAFDKLFLSMQHFRANIGVMEILGSILVLFTIGLLTVLSQTYKAANANPTDTLRYE